MTNQSDENEGLCSDDLSVRLHRLVTDSSEDCSGDSDTNRVLRKSVVQRVMLMYQEIKLHGQYTIKRLLLLNLQRFRNKHI